MLQERRSWVLGWLFFRKAMKHYRKRTEYPFFIYCIPYLKDGLNSSAASRNTYHLQFIWQLRMHCQGHPFFWEITTKGSSLLLLHTWPLSPFLNIHEYQKQQTKTSLNSILLSFFLKSKTRSRLFSSHKEDVKPSDTF